jgi:long-chain acyl-CoA synthetase
MGILSKNRWEWTVTELASVRQGGTTVAFYDTLGPAAVEYIIKQTELTTISCSGNYLDVLIKLKASGGVPSLQNLVSFDFFTLD